MCNRHARARAAVIVASSRHPRSPSLPPHQLHHAHHAHHAHRLTASPPTLPPHPRHTHPTPTFCCLLLRLQVLGIRGFDLDRVLESEPEFLDTEGEHVHDQTVTSVGFNQVSRRCRTVTRPLRECDTTVIRLSPRPSYDRHHDRPHHSGSFPWLLASLGHDCYAAVTDGRSFRIIPLAISVAGPWPNLAPTVTRPLQMGELDLDKTNSWIGKLLQLKGADIFRMKVW